MAPYNSYKLLMERSTFFLGLSSAIGAGIVVALAPRRLTVKERVAKLSIPAMLLVLLIPWQNSVYRDAEKKYDFGKETLAEATGLPATALETRTVVLCTAEHQAPQAWQLIATGSGFFVIQNTVALSSENLKTLDAYLAQHGSGTKFRSAAQDALAHGYFSLWEVRQGIEQLYKNARTMLFPRLLLVAKLKRMPVTPENLAYLKAFADERAWISGGNASLGIAEAFMHFGYREEAQRWLNSAKESGADVSKSTFLNEPVFTDGKIRGAITILGRPPAKARIGLLNGSSPIRTINHDAMPRLLLDVRDPDETGKFEFTRLGKGEYLLAVMTDQATIPLPVAAGTFSIQNSPGIIKLDIDTPLKTVGKMNVTWNN